MLSDAAFTSPWSSELLITGDCNLPLFDDNDDVLDFYKTSTNDTNRRPHFDSLSGSSCVTTGSECSSDDLYVDDDGFLHNAELSSCIGTGIDSDLADIADTSTLDNINWLNNDFSPSVPCSSSSSVDNDWSPVMIPEASQAFTCVTTPPTSTCRSHHKKNALNKKWSQMSRSEKLKKIDDLSATINSELDFREQVNIVKIINPGANVNKIEEEFVIDLESINDSKLQQIQNIVTFHCSQNLDNVEPSRNIHSPDKKFSKKNKTQDRRPSGKLPRQRVQKEYRQKLKERRSGLFAKEERLAVSSQTIEEDIDVLG